MPVINRDFCKYFLILHISNMKTITKIFCITVSLISFQAGAQTAPDKYWVQFSDKNNSPYSTSDPSQYLSQRSISRRINQGIAVTESDLPVNPDYIDSVISKGAQVLTVSKWFNGATVFTTDPAVVSAIQSLPFVSGISKSCSRKKNIAHGNDKFSAEEAGQSASLAATRNIDYGEAYTQIHMMNGEVLHNLGYLGQGMVISVIDAGFNGADSLSAFDSLWQNTRILGWRDFVDKQNNLFDSTHSHGMNVLSIIAGNIPGLFLGTAPGASFWLLRAEDGSSEYLIEEDNWVAAAEFADSAGTDVINTSLGYSTFDDSLQDHTYADMTGATTKIARGVNMASSKGVLVVVSAGNSGTSPWHYITTPGDADSALTVGAVDLNGDQASFSSVGPAADGDIKPNVTAMGKGTFYIGNDDQVHSGNGTSFSTPLVCGLATCLWQSYPSFSAFQIKQAIEQSASQFLNPDFQKGYGIPDFGLAYQIISTKSKSAENLIRAFPNPFSDNLAIEFYTPVSQRVKIELLNLFGVAVHTENFNFQSDSYNKFLLHGLNSIPVGAYILKVSATEKIFMQKILKVK